MDFELSEKHRKARDHAREFAETVLAPVAKEQDEREEFPHKQMRAAGEQGFLGLLVPARYGGLGCDTLTYALVIEELSRKHAAFGVPISVHNSLVCYPILQYGTEEQRQRYLPRLARGELLGGFALTEPESGSDASAMTSRSVRSNGCWVLTGKKAYISMGGTGSLFLVAAVTDPATKTSHSISCFLVERGTEGFSTGRKLSKMGMRATDTTELLFKDVRLPERNLLGESGEGFKIALSALDCGRIGIASQALGIAQAALEESLAYSRSRHQFGKPISEFQAIQFKLAEMATEIEAARMLTWKAAVLKDSGKPYARHAAMCKLLASQVAVRCANDAVQIHGGLGYVKDGIAERLYRDAKVTEIYEGTSEIQKIVIAESLLREGKLKERE